MFFDILVWPISCLPLISLKKLWKGYYPRIENKHCCQCWYYISRISGYKRCRDKIGERIIFLAMYRMLNNGCMGFFSLLLISLFRRICDPTLNIIFQRKQNHNKESDSKLMRLGLYLFNYKHLTINILLWIKAFKTCHFLMNQS